MLEINNKINQYLVYGINSGKIEFIMSSYYPMNKQDVIMTLYQERIIRKSNDIVLQRITEENVCEFNIPEDCEFVSNLED